MYIYYIKSTTMQLILCNKYTYIFHLIVVSDKYTHNSNLSTAEAASKALAVASQLAETSYSQLPISCIERPLLHSRKLLIFSPKSTFNNSSQLAFFKIMFISVLQMRFDTVSDVRYYFLILLLSLSQVKAIKGLRSV